MHDVFRWLHLTDLHFGADHHREFLPFMKSAFLDDLSKQLEERGPIHLVILSGDFVDRCNWSGYGGKLTEFVKDLQRIAGLHCRYVAVPGNHDLVRQGSTTDQAKLYDQFASSPDAFFSDPQHEFRVRLSSASDSYDSWWRSVDLPTPENYRSGLLPGEFAAEMTSPLSVGIVGLNSSYLSILESNGMHVDLRQWHYPCLDDGPAWCKQRQLRILVTHHPVRKLRLASQDAFRFFQAGGFFHVHLCGDLHLAEALELQDRRQRPWHSWQGATLFGTVKYQDGQVIWNGYSIGEARLDDGHLQLRQFQRMCALPRGFSAAPECGTQWECVERKVTSSVPLPPPRKASRDADAFLAVLPELGEHPRPFETLIPWTRGNTVLSINDLGQAIDLFKRLVHEHDHQNALRLLCFHLARPLYFQLSEFEVLVSLLETARQILPESASAGLAAWTLDAMASCRGRLGDCLGAVKLYSEAIRLLDAPSLVVHDAESSVAENATSSLAEPLLNGAIIRGNRLMELVRLGRLREAHADATYRLRLLPRAENSEGRFHLGTAHVGAGYIATLVGKPKDASNHFDSAEPLLKAHSNSNVSSFVPLGRAILSLALVQLGHVDSPGGAIPWAAKAVEASKGETQRDRVRAKVIMGLVGAACAATGQDEAAKILAESHLDDALIESRKLHQREIEPDILLGLALCRGSVGPAKQALQVAQSCGYRLKEADAHIRIAELLSTSREKDVRVEACERLQTAIACAECDDRDFCYAPAISRANKLSRLLGCSHGI